MVEQCRPNAGGQNLNAEKNANLVSEDRLRRTGFS
jgi:hypothetical protein